MAGSRTPSSDGTDDRLLVVNPTSGAADHVERVRRLAADRGFAVRETERAGHAVELAREAAAAGVETLGVAGGDGTLNETVRGLDAVDALDRVTLGAVPVGTENLFATYVGIGDIEEGFDALESGETRRIDLGMADDHPFIVSCICGLPAEASVATSSTLKERLGPLAFVATGLREALRFDGLRLEIEAVSGGGEITWSGEALCALVGNLRRFVGRGGQANAEDGLFDVVVVEEMPAFEALEEAAMHRLLDRDTEHVRHLRASQLRVVGRDADPLDFSLDGEPDSASRRVLYCRPRALGVRVGDAYDPAPD